MNLRSWLLRINFKRISELLARYYGNLYNDQEQENVAKRAPQPDQVEEELFPRYVQRRSGTNGYWNLLKALEEELALEGMSKQGIEDDGRLLFKTFDVKSILDTV